MAKKQQEYGNDSIRQLKGADRRYDYPTAG